MHKFKGSWHYDLITDIAGMKAPNNDFFYSVALSFSLLFAIFIVLSAIAFFAFVGLLICIGVVIVVFVLIYPIGVLFLGWYSDIVFLISSIIFWLSAIISISSVIRTVIKERKRIADVYDSFDDGEKVNFNTDKEV